MPGGRRWAGLGAGLAAAAVIEVSVAAVLAVQQGLTFTYLLEGHEVSAAVVGVAFGAVGAAVVWRQPRHRLGWLFILVSQLLCLSGVGARYGSVSPPLPLSGLVLLCSSCLLCSSNFGDCLEFSGGVRDAGLVDVVVEVVVDHVQGLA